MTGPNQIKRDIMEAVEDRWAHARAQVEEARARGAESPPDVLAYWEGQVVRWWDAVRVARGVWPWR